MLHDDGTTVREASKPGMVGEAKFLPFGIARCKDTIDKDGPKVEGSSLHGGLDLRNWLGVGGLLAEWFVWRVFVIGVDGK